MTLHLARLGFHKVVVGPGLCAGGPAAAPTEAPLRVTMKEASDSACTVNTLLLC